MVSEHAALIAANYAKKVINRNGVEAFNKCFQKTNEEIIKEKIKQKVSCPECGQSFFFNEKEEKFYCPVCKNG